MATPCREAVHLGVELEEQRTFEAVEEIFREFVDPVARERRAAIPAERLDFDRRLFCVNQQLSLVLARRRA